MTRRQRLRGVVKVSDLVEREWLPASRSARDKCLRCGHQRMDHHRYFRQCLLEPAECHWFVYEPLKVILGGASRDPAAGPSA